MSYCRFSTDDYQCDVYAYDDCMGGITIHVAGSRYIYAEPLPPHVPFSTENLDAWMERHNKVMAMVEAAGREKIKAKHAGESFYGLDQDSAVALMEELKSLGYKFPDDVVDAMQEEVEDEATSKENSDD